MENSWKIENAVEKVSSTTLPNNDVGLGTHRPYKSEAGRKHVVC